MCPLEGSGKCRRTRGAATLYAGMGRFALISALKSFDVLGRDLAAQKGGLK